MHLGGCNRLPNNKLMKIQRQVMKSEVSAEGNIAVLQGVCRVKSVVVLQNRVVGRKAETQNAGGILSGQPDDTTRVPPCSLVIISVAQLVELQT